MYRIKSKAYEEYLYAAADDLAYDTARRRVFTWSDKASEPPTNVNWDSTGEH